MFKLFRLARVFRVFKISKYNGNIQLCATAMMESKDTLGLMAFMLTICVIVFSAFIFFYEHGKMRDDGIWLVTDDMCTASYQARQEDPTVCEQQTGFESIPGSAWWTIVTVMTVGYGDQYPRTTGGKVVATVAMICSIVILALPISVIGANFSRAWMERKEEDEKYMDGHEISIVYKNMIMNLSQHNSILEDILSEGSIQMDELQANLTAAKKEYDALLKQQPGLVDHEDSGIAPCVEPSPRLKNLLAKIDMNERILLEKIDITKNVQNAEFDQGVADAIQICNRMERVIAEQCMLSAKIEAKEKQTMGRLLSVPATA